MVNINGIEIPFEALVRLADTVTLEAIATVNPARAGRLRTAWEHGPLTAGVLGISFDVIVTAVINEQEAAQRDRRLFRPGNVHAEVLAAIEDAANGALIVVPEEIPS